MPGSGARNFASGITKQKMYNRLYGLYNPISLNCLEYLSFFEQQRYDEKSNKLKAAKNNRTLEKSNQNMRQILHGTVRQCFVYTVKLLLSLLALSDSHTIITFL